LLAPATLATAPLSNAAPATTRTVAVADHNYTAAMNVQFNIWGGRGNAVTGYNLKWRPLW
jgi:hypothetical protein